MRIIAKLRSLIIASRHDEKGAILAEYGMIAAGIAAVVAAAVWTFGGAVMTLYDLPF